MFLLHNVMYPILLSVNDISIYALGTMIVLGFMVFNIIIIRLSPLKKLNIKFWNNHIISLVVVTIIGARIFYVLTRWERFQQDWGQIWLPDGFSFYGGIIAFLVLLHIYTQKHKEHFLLWTDLFTVAFFPWLFFSAIGHFLDGSNYGIPTDLPWGITIDNIASPVPYTVPIHPTQLYEALYALIIFIFLLRMYHTTKTKGLVTFIGGFLLGTCDFFLNYVLGEPTTMIGTLRLDQVFAMLFLTICGGMLFSFFLKQQEE